MTTLAAQPRKTLSVPLVLLVSAGFILAVGGALWFKTARGHAAPPLSEQPKGVTTVPVVDASWRAQRRFVGTLEPWVEARVGPQLISAYVDTVLVRPGASVKKGQVLATLDCRGASAVSKAVGMQARALEASQMASANEARRVEGLLARGFVSTNEAEVKRAESQSKEAQLLAARAQLSGTTLQVSDCVLRAPFDGEVAERLADPGAYVRPGNAVVTVIDRRTIRVVADAPETDFDAIAPKTPVTIAAFATGAELRAQVSRRAPAADPGSRTVRFEIDLPNTDRSLPVGTTADVRLAAGSEQRASVVPLPAGSVRGERVSLFVVDAGVAHKRTAKLLGERSGRLYLEPLPTGTRVVTEGRTTLLDGDRVRTEAP
ncbi:MAG: efflux RND transporter periplasmic adaptor subunit [Deltaproteobacteria bacterium]|nr:efflux RND transporter periplasmic adaptor subunit [Deltaproteobacteria bacterium]